MFLFANVKFGKDKNNELITLSGNLLMTLSGNLININKCTFFIMV